MMEEQKVRFSIKPAYAFGEVHDLEKEVSAIRDKHPFARAGTSPKDHLGQRGCEEVRSVRG
jgi:hypothetical protein